MASVRDWVVAARLRTLPLAFSCILMGAFLALRENVLRWDILLLALSTTLFLRILSNLANDYGDSVSGVDHVEREGPARTVQTGSISLKMMKRGIAVCSVLSFASGITLILLAFPGNWSTILLFVLIGFAAIAAAINYTVGRNPYGYQGFGDLFVFIFFGIVGVGGSYFLQIGELDASILLPASSLGLFSVGVLNVNNVRDIESDRKAGKRSIPVRIGRKNALRYHVLLIGLGWISCGAYTLFNSSSPYELLYFLTLPLFIIHLRKVTIAQRPSEIDPYLKQLAISTMIFVLIFGLGVAL